MLSVNSRRIEKLGFPFPGSAALYGALCPAAGPGAGHARGLAAPMARPDRVHVVGARLLDRMSEPPKGYCVAPGSVAQPGGHCGST